MVPIYNTVYETTAVTVFSVSMEFPLTVPVNGCYSQLYLANMALAHLPPNVVYRTLSLTFECA